jgi:hypothetical protein
MIPGALKKTFGHRLSGVPGIHGDHRDHDQLDLLISPNRLTKNNSTNLF